MPDNHREAAVSRTTSETNVVVAVGLDGPIVSPPEDSPFATAPSGKRSRSIDTGIGFLDHMLEQIAKHSGIDVYARVQGDLEIDMHHSFEDCGIVFGQALHKALGDGRGITRFGQASVPMDDALAEVSLDISGRGFCVWNVVLPTQRVGTVDTELFEEWFRAVAANAKITLHVNCRYGNNSHHMIEACFKALARALRQAVARDGRGALPSTKDVLFAE